MDSTTVQTLFDAAAEKQREADKARVALASVMLQAMRACLSPGTVVKLNARPLPEYLLRVSTHSGNDRGTKTFRIVEVTGVDVNVATPELSTWSCTAVPISEKTGKDMSGATHGADSRQTVRLKGDMGCLLPDDDGTATVARLVKRVADAVGGAPAESASRPGPVTKI